MLNLAPADTHAAITRACLRAGGKVGLFQKPLAATLEEADDLIALAEQNRSLLACAPATILWPPLATVRRIVSQGQLSRIVGALTTLVYPEPELFHSHPVHLYRPAAGPPHDMGGYQVTALMALLGPVITVSAMASQARRDDSRRTRRWTTSHGPVSDSRPCPVAARK